MKQMNSVVFEIHTITTLKREKKELTKVAQEYNI